MNNRQFIFNTNMSECSDEVETSNNDNSIPSSIYDSSDSSITYRKPVHSISSNSSSDPSITYRKPVHSISSNSSSDIKTVIDDSVFHKESASKSSKANDINSIFTSSTINKNNIISNKINNTIVIDVAVLCQEYTNVETMCNDHIVNLDEIPISKELFQSIFYPYGENFGLNKDYVCNNKEIFPYISFLPEFRSVNNKRFYLLEELISNIESDLNVSRNCFTKESLVELTNEIFDIKSLCNINCCSVLSSLTWLNINEIVNNYKLVHNSCSENIIIILVVNIIFKTPTPGVKNTLIRLQYRIT
jgi:hypothetical protein